MGGTKMKSDEFTDVMLPKYFWYHGMNKIKAGKGYMDGKPLGVIGDNCTECDGLIIKLQMNTSSKGFETTSESVCDKCGLVEGGPFMVMETRSDPKYPKLQRHHEVVEEEDLALRKYTNDKGEELYKKRQMSIFDIGHGREKHYHETPAPTGAPNIEKTMYKVSYEHYHETHKEWLDCNTPEGLPTLQDLDLKMGVNEDVPDLPEPLMDIYEWTAKEIKTGYEMGTLTNPKRAVLYNRPDEERKAYEVGQQKRYADVVASRMQLNKFQREQVEYIMEIPNILNISRYSYEEVIEHICLYVISRSIKPQRYSVYVREYKRYNDYNKRLYELIKGKLDNTPLQFIVTSPSIYTEILKKYIIIGLPVIALVITSSPIFFIEIF